MRASFTLLHGTWAAHAPWTLAGSPMHARLKARFGPETPVHSLNWGGWNRVSTRSRGAKLLADHLKNLHLADDERHFVVAHSHGGNVAMVALNDAVAANRVAGIATLATPFLVVGKRRWSDSLDSAQLTLLTPLSLMILAAGAMAADRVGGGWTGWAIFAVLSVLLFAGLWLLVRGWDRFADKVVHNMQFGRIATDRLLILRSPGDEASVILLASRALLAVGLVALSVLSHLCLRLQALLARGRQRPALGWLFGLGVLALWLASLWLAGTALENRQPWAMPLLGLVLALSVFLLLPVAFSAFGQDNQLVMMTWHWFMAALMLVAAIVPSLLLVVYGWRLVVANIAVEISAEATPTGEWRVMTLPAEHALGDSAAAVMTHSSLYNDQRAIDRICEWVQTTLDAEARAAAALAQATDAPASDAPASDASSEDPPAPQAPGLA